MSKIFKKYQNYCQSFVKKEHIYSDNWIMSSNNDELCAVVAYSYSSNLSHSKTTRKGIL